MFFSLAIITAIILFAPGILIYFVVGQAERNFKNKCTQTRGVITKTWIYDREGVTGSTTREYLVSYTFPAGAGLYTQAVEKRDYERLKTGDAVSVLYVPADPRRSRLEQLKTPWN